MQGKFLIEEGLCFLAITFDLNAKQENVMIQKGFLTKECESTTRS